MNLSDAQNDCINKVQEMLGEHFEAHVVMVMINDDQKREAQYIAHSGGFAVARGLLEIGIDKLKRREVKASTGGEDE